jgi:hypothetical protein
MTDDPERSTDRLSRRKFVLATCAAGTAGLAGCARGGGDTPTPRVERETVVRERTVVQEQTVTRSTEDLTQLHTVAAEADASVPVYLYGINQGVWREYGIDLSVEVAAFGKFVRQIVAGLTNIKGIDRQSLDLRFGALPNLFGQVQSGDLDGFLGVPPLTLFLLDSGDYHTVFELSSQWEATTGYPLAAGEMTTWQETVDEKPDAIKGFFNANMEANQYIKDNIDSILDDYQETIGWKNQSQRQMFVELIERFPEPTEFKENWRQGGIATLRLASEHDLIDVDYDVDEIYYDPREL